MLSVYQNVYQGLSTYKTKDMMKYIINQFKVLGKEAKDPEHYYQYRLSNETMSRIIALGLKTTYREEIQEVQSWSKVVQQDPYNCNHIKICQDVQTILNN